MSSQPLWPPCTATQPRQTDIDLLPKLGRTWPSLLKCQGNPQITLDDSKMIPAGRKWGVPPPRLSTVTRWQNHQRWKDWKSVGWMEIFKTQMSGTVSEVLVPCLPGLSFIWSLLTGWCICMHLWWQNLSLASVHLFREKRKKTTENHNISDIPQQILSLSRAPKKKPWNHWGKGAEMTPWEFLRLPTRRLPGSRASDGQRLHLPQSFQKNMKRPKKKRPDFWTVCDMYLTSRCWPSVVSQNARLDPPSTSDISESNQFSTCHCQGLHVCSPNQIRHSAWDNLSVYTSNLIS